MITKQQAEITSLSDTVSGHVLTITEHEEQVLSVIVACFCIATVFIRFVDFGIFLQQHWL